MKKAKLLNNILGLIASLYSLYLIFITDGDIYGKLIKLTIIPIIFLPQIINKLFRVNINTYIATIYTIFIFLAHFMGSILNFYQAIYWYDSFAHFLSGILVSFLATYLLVILNKYSEKSVLFNILFILGMSFMVAGMWEMFEFTSDKLFGKDAQNVLTTGVDDTMKDMIVAALGTILYLILYVYEEINNKRIFIKNFICDINKK